MEELNETGIIAPADWSTSEEIIKVMGVGGAGCNAVNNMYRKGIEGCSFVVCNTDAMSLRDSPIGTKIQMGQGLGAGTNPTIGRNAAMDAEQEIKNKIINSNTQMLFITAGMGGGTGTGAAPVIANMAKSAGILTIGVITLPFKNEGAKTLTRAIDGLKEMEANVDSLIVIDNQKLYEHYGSKLIHEAIPLADEVLFTAVRGIIEIIQKPGYINVDFCDVRSMMKDSGMALMGYGSGSGSTRLQDAVDGAFKSPLLNNFDLRSARNVLVNVTVGHNDKGLTMDEMDELNRMIDDCTGGANNFKRGLIYDNSEEIGDQIHITSIVTGLRFRDVVENNRDMGNYIFLSKDYTYDNQSEGSVAFPTEENNERFTPGEFKFESSEKPCLLVEDEEDYQLIKDLKDTTALRRK